MNNVQVTAGDHNRSNFEGTEQTSFIEYILEDDNDPSHGLAMVKLEEPLTFTDAVQPTKLPEPMQEHTGKASVASWSFLTFEGQTDTPYGALLTLVDDDTCRITVQSVINMFIGPGDICAGDQDGQDFCQAASGGPLICSDDEGDDVLCGVVVLAPKACDAKGLPGVYTQVSYHLDFINNRA